MSAQSKKNKNLSVHGQNVSSVIPQFISFCRQDKDSKDEAANAEKELEEICKVIAESGGKLSNRVLQCEVRKQERALRDVHSVAVGVQDSLKSG